jgi:sugar fermentation stimulation protein A
MLDLSKIQESKYLFNKPEIFTFKKREKRFFSYHVDVNNNEVIGHCVNTGKMAGLLIPDNLSILSEKNTGLPYTWEAVKTENGWIGVNTFTPNKLVKQMLENGLIPGETFQQEKLIKEFKFKPDFSNEKYIIEVKHVHWVKNNIGYFPDCETERGARQLDAMLELKKQGKEIILIYILQNNHADKLTIAKDIDPIYYEKCLEGKKLGIKSFAFNCNVTLEGVFINSLIDFYL